MTTILFGLVIAYIFLLAMAVLAMVYSQWPTLIKFLLLISVLALGLFSYQQWKLAQGWPSGDAVPERFLLNGAIIEEPDKNKGTKGAVYLWLSDLQNDELADLPRAYRLEYNQKLHGQLQEALRKMRDGKLQLGENKSASEGALNPKFSKRLGSEKHNLLEFSDLPDPALPEK